MASLRQLRASLDRLEQFAAAPVRDDNGRYSGVDSSVTPVDYAAAYDPNPPEARAKRRSLLAKLTQAKPPAPPTAPTA